MAAIRADELTSLETLVLEHLTASRITHSVVSLAADMWKGDFAMGGDPVGLVQYLVEGLADRGLVNYTEGKSSVHVFGLSQPHPWDGLALHIRLSKDGWALMGYPNRISVVGTRSSTSQHLEPHRGDPTNFRRHGDKAEGGPIEKDTFAEHQAAYPQHVHMYGDDDTMPLDKRVYTKVAADMEAEVVAYKARHPLADYATIADITGVPKRTVEYILTDLPRLRRAADPTKADASLKQRIIWALEVTEFENVAALRAVLSRSDDSHNIVHVLHSLHKEGKVDFIEKGAEKTPIRIHMTARGRGEGLKKDQPLVLKRDDNELLPHTNGTMATVETLPPFVAKRVHESVVIDPSADGNDHPDEYDAIVTDELDAAAEAMAKALELDDYPLLDDLLDRERQRQKSDGKALQYIQAAELLREQDPETAALLDAKAAENDVPFPSPLETEYLKYQQAHPRFEFVDADGRLSR